MVKFVPARGGSGAHDSVSGWINIFYPYMIEGENYYMESWKELKQDRGPDPEDFPQLLLSTPVTWDYLGKVIKFHFHSGIVGAIQDKKTFALSPCSAWIISRDSPNDM